MCSGREKVHLAASPPPESLYVIGGQVEKQTPCQRISIFNPSIYCRPEVACHILATYFKILTRHRTVDEKHTLWDYRERDGTMQHSQGSYILDSFLAFNILAMKLGTFFTGVNEITNCRK